MSFEDLLNARFDRGAVLCIGLDPRSATAALALAGPGRVSVDAMVRWKWSGLRWGGVACLVGLAVGLFVLVVWGVGVGGTPPPPAF